MKRLFLVLALVFFTITPASSQASNDLAAMPNLQSEIHRGKVLKKNILYKVEKFLGATNRPELLAASVFFSKNTVLAIPTAENPRPLQATDKDSVLLIFLSKEDAKISPEWEEMSLVEKPVEFYPDIAALVIQTDKIASLDPTALAIAVLQKTYEASLFNKNGRIIENDETYEKNQEEVRNFLTEAFASK